MVQIDDQFLDDLGLSSIPQDQKDLMRADITESLADRIGVKAEQVLSKDKLAELDGVINGARGNQAVIDGWLVANLPDYQQIIDAEVAKIKEEISPQVAGIVGQFQAG